MATAEFGWRVTKHITAARMKNSLLGYAVNVKSLFDYVDKFAGADAGRVSERLRSLLEFRSVCETLRYSYVLLYRIADIARLVGKKPYKVFFELVSLRAVPAFAISRTSKVRAWFVPYCTDLERYLRRELGRRGLDFDEFVPDRYVLVEVPSEDERRAMMVSAMADRVVKNLPLLASAGLLVSRLKERLEDLPLTEDEIEMFKVALDEMITDLQDLAESAKNDFAEYSYVRLGDRVFVWRPIYLLSLLLQFPEPNLSKQTILKRGYKYLTRRLSKVNFTLKQLDLNEVRRYMRVLGGCDVRNSKNLRFRFYGCVDPNIKKDADRAQVDPIGARYLFLRAMCSMREANAKMNPVINEIRTRAFAPILKVPDRGYQRLTGHLADEMWRAEREYKEWFGTRFWKSAPFLVYGFPLGLPVLLGRPDCLSELGMKVVYHFGFTGHYMLAKGEDPPWLTEQQKEFMMHRYQRFVEAWTQAQVECQVS